MPAATVNPCPTEPSHCRLLPAQAVDEIAATDPSRPYVFVPQSTRPEDGWVPITFEQLARAVDHMAHTVARTVKQASSDANAFPTLAYVGPNDVRYAIIMFACNKAGCQALFISPRNSPEIQQSLFEKTDCSHFWYAESFHLIVRPWTQAWDRPMQVSAVPSVEKCLGSTSAPFPYSRPFEEARYDTLVVLHTSGSTGIPKPVVVRQGVVAIADELRNLPPLHNARFMWEECASRSKRLFLPLPLFHTAGLTASMVLHTIYFRVPPALPMPDQPLSPDLVQQCLLHADADAAFLLPSMIEQLSSSEDGLDVLKRLNFVGFAGGNLSHEVGDRLVKHGIRLSNGISTTENLPYAVFWQPKPELWRYFIFNSEAMGAVWRCHDEAEGIFELILRRRDADGRGQPVFLAFPEANEWSTGDLFKAHPHLSDHWMYLCRSDDIIVFSNGEKLNPVAIEGTLMGHPAIKGALVVGQDRFQPALILEPLCQPKEDEALISEIWPLIEKANGSTVGQGRIVRHLVSIAVPEIPFLRAAKGTIQRRATVKAYEKHIDMMYEAGQSDIQDIIPTDLSSEASLAQSIVQLIHKFGFPDAGLDTDIFSMGFDSLQVLRMSKTLQASFKASKTGEALKPDVIEPRVIFSNPTPQRLANRLILMAKSGSRAELDDAERETQSLGALVSKYSQNLPAPGIEKPEALDNGQTIILTGSTGSLGAYLLDQLCASPRVKKVFVLNRGKDGGRARQSLSSASRGLRTDFSSVEFLGADLSLPDLGLGGAKYDELLESADRIIHNAWPVNLNIASVTSFEPHIRGVRNLIDLSSKAAKRVLIVFVSSILTAGAWQSPEPVPEARLEDLSLASTGYGRSKLAASLILDSAIRHSGIAAATVRVGQIAGPRGRKGMWNKQEYIPSLIASSLYMGKLPSHFGVDETVDWLVVDDVAALILEIAGATADNPVSRISGRYFHAVNPVKTTWGELAAGLMAYYPGRLELVSFEDWISALKDSAGGTTDPSRNPAIKLIDLYEDMLEGFREGRHHTRFEMAMTMGHSKTAAQLERVTTDLLQNWCSQWDF